MSTHKASKKKSLIHKTVQTIAGAAALCLATVATAAEVVRDAGGNVIAIRDVTVAGVGQLDVDLEDGPRKFNEIWPGFPSPQAPPMFWGNPDGARAARDAVVEVLQAEHAKQKSLVGGGRVAFVVPIGATGSGQLTSTLGYYRHYNDWLWSKGRGVDTVDVDAGCGAGGFDKAVYARFKRRDAFQVIRDASGNVIAIKGLTVSGYGRFDVDLEDGPRKFNEIWPSFPSPQTLPAFWGNADGARAARDAVVEVLQAEHAKQKSLVGGGRFAFVVPIGATGSGQLTSTLGYYRHYNDWLWSKGRGVDTVDVDAGCGEGGFDKAVYARFERR